MNEADDGVAGIEGHQRPMLKIPVISYATACRIWIGAVAVWPCQTDLFQIVGIIVGIGAYGHSMNIYVSSLQAATPNHLSTISLFMDVPRL